MLNVSCPHAELYAAVQTVSHGVSGRSTQPVQNNIYLETSGSTLRLVATDLEFISLEAVLEAKVTGEGAVTVPARLLTEVVGSLPEADISLEGDEHNTLRVSCEQSRYEIRGMAAADFEMLPVLAEAHEFELSQADLHLILSQTAFATSADETRPILTGALFSITPEGLQVVATDTYRLALRKLPGAIKVEEPREAIISARALIEMLRALDPDSEEPASLAVSDNQVSLSVDNVTIGSRLIEGQFPNYEKVLPEESDKRLVVDARALAAALRRAVIVAREDAYRVVLKGTADALQVTADSQDVGHVEESMAASLEGEEIEIAFNARYLLDVLEAIPEQQVVFELSEQLSPGTVRPLDSEDYLYVIMPMQIMV
jgi:DNA polymerase-3 subunit beta